MSGFVSADGEDAQHTLTFDGNGNNAGKAPDAREYAEGENVVLPEPGNMKKSGEAFRGWGETGDAADPLDSFTMPGHDVTLYALWGKPAVTFLGNGTDPEKTTVDCEIGKKIPGSEVPDVSRDKYVMTGWYKDPELKKKWDFGNDTVPDRSITLYAGWEPIVGTSLSLDRDFCGTKGATGNNSVVATVSSVSTVYYSATVKGPDGKESTTNISGYSGNVYSTSDKSITFNAPDKAGEYILKVKFYTDSSKEDLISEKKASISVVEPVLLKATLVNKSHINMEINVFFKVNGEKVEGSDMEITVPANGEKEVEYKYVTKKLSRAQNFSIEVEDEDTVAGHIDGLGVKYSFYGSQNSYSWAVWLLAIAVVITFLIMVSVYRKPVKNLGKPKSRR